MTLKGAASKRRKKQRRKPKNRAELLRARRRYCEERAPSMAPCNLEQGSFLRHERVRLFKQKILPGTIFPSQVTKGRKRNCTFYVTKDQSTGEGLPPYSDYGQHTSRGKFTMWSYCDGRVEGDMGHKTKAAAKKKAERAAAFDPASYQKRQKRRRRRAKARALS